MSWHHVDVAITLVFCLGVVWGAIRAMVWVFYGRIPSLTGEYWCHPRQVFCNAKNCPCWDDEQTARRADLERQRR